MNVICDCLRKNLNGGVCDCLDNFSSDDTYEEKSSYLDFEEDEEDDSIPSKKKGRFTDDSDLWFTN